MNWINEIEQATHQKIVKHEILPGGLTNTNYQVTFEDGSQGVVRVPPMHNQGLFDYANEYQVLLAIQAAPLDVPTLYFNPRTGIKLTRYIPHARTFQDATSWTVEHMKQLAHHLVTLHHLQSTTIHPFHLLEKIEHYQHDIVFPLHTFDTSSLFIQIQQLYQRYPLVLCHNDLVPGNILCAENVLYLIDYEYAGLNIFLFDIASFLNENNLSYDHPLVDHFLTSYYQHSLTPEELADIRSMDKIQCFLWHAWANRQWEKTNEIIYREIADLKYQRYLQLVGQEKKG